MCPDCECATFGRVICRADSGYCIDIPALSYLKYVMSKDVFSTMMQSGWLLCRQGA